GLDRAREDLVVPEVVRDARELARIREGDRGERRAVLAEAARPLLGEVHRVAHAPAVAAGEQEAAVLQRRRCRLREATDALEAGGIREEGREDSRGLVEGLADGIHRASDCGRLPSPAQLAMLFPPKS